MQVVVKEGLFVDPSWLWNAVTAMPICAKRYTHHFQELEFDQQM